MSIFNNFVITEYVFKFKINKILLKKVGKNMLKQKKPVVFEPKNLESLIQGLDKKDLESLIKIIKYKIESQKR